MSKAITKKTNPKNQLITYQIVVDDKQVVNTHKRLTAMYKTIVLIEKAVKRLSDTLDKSPRIIR